MQAWAKYIARYVLCVWVLGAVCTVRASIGCTENGGTITWWIKYRVIAHAPPILILHCVARMHLVQVSFGTLMRHCGLCIVSARFRLWVFLLGNGFHIPSGFSIRIHAGMCQWRWTSWCSPGYHQMIIVTTLLNFKGKWNIFLEKDWQTSTSRRRVCMLLQITPPQGVHGLPTQRKTFSVTLIESLFQS